MADAHTKRTKEPRQFCVVVLATVTAHSPREAEEIMEAWCDKARLTKKITELSVADGPDQTIDLDA